MKEAFPFHLLFRLLPISLNLMKLLAYINFYESFWHGLGGTLLKIIKKFVED